MEDQALCSGCGFLPFLVCVPNFAEVTLAVYYRETNKEGDLVGGPMYYIKKWPWKELAVLAVLFFRLRCAHCIWYRKCHPGQYDHNGCELCSLKLRTDLRRGSKDFQPDPGYHHCRFGSPDPVRRCKAYWSGNREAGSFYGAPLYCVICRYHPL